MDVDIIYYGNFHTDGLLDLLTNGKYQDPFWKTIKHMAFGMHKFHFMVELWEGRESDEESVVEKGLEELQQFPALRTVTLVLDGIYHSSRGDPKDKGIITLGDPSPVFRDSPYRSGYHTKWTSFLTKEWDDVALTHPTWTIPSLRIKSLSRGGKLKHPTWHNFIGGALSEALRSARAMRNGEESDLESESESETDVSESEDSTSQEDESEDLDSDSTTHGVVQRALGTLERLLSRMNSDGESDRSQDSSSDEKTEEAEQDDSENMDSEDEDESHIPWHLRSY